MPESIFTLLVLIVVALVAGAVVGWIARRFGAHGTWWAAGLGLAFLVVLWVVT